MARNLAHYKDAEEERRKLALLDEAFGPPPPPSMINLGVARAPAIPADALDMTTPRATDGNYANFHDSYQDEEPTEEELAADAAAEEEQEAPVAGESRLDVLLEANPYAGRNLGDYATQLSLGEFAREPANRFEEAAQTRAAAQARPTAVDPTAASVGDEQKGVPATSRTEQAIARIEQEPRASTLDHATEANRFYQDAANGRGFLGVGDLPNFRDERATRAREAYGDEEAPSHQWEEEFLRGRERLSDAQIRRRSAVMGVFGDPGQGEHWAELQRRHGLDYDRGLAEARAADQSNRRVSRGLAEAIAATGQVSPEEAAQLRMNDPLVKNFGQYASQGGRYEGQQIGLRKNQNSEMVKLISQAMGIDEKRLEAFLNAESRVESAEVKANATRMPTEEEVDGAASLLEQTLKLPGGKGIGRRILAGDLSGLPAELQDQASRMRQQLIARLQGRNGLNAALDESIKTQANQPIKDEYSIRKSLEIARSNPNERTKFKKDWESSAIMFREAWGAWSSLSKDAQTRFSEWAAGGFTGDILKFLSTPEEQEKFAAVRGVINSLVKDRSGSAVTGSEWERIAGEIGLEADNWGPFNTSGSVTKYLNRTGKILETHRDVFESEYGWETPRGR